MEYTTATALKAQCNRTLRKLEKLADSIDQLEKQLSAGATRRQESQIEARLDALYHRAAVDELRSLEYDARVIMRYSSDSRRPVKRRRPRATESAPSAPQVTESAPSAPWGPPSAPSAPLGPDGSAPVGAAPGDDLGPDGSAPVARSVMGSPFLSLSEAIEIHALRSDIGGS